jgi:molybdopterin converting factor subunit 1
MNESNGPRTIAVRCFAALREAAGAEVLRVTLPADGDVSALRHALLRAHPSLEALLPSTAVAVNQRLVGDDAVLREGDEVALLPPVSGG